MMRGLLERLRVFIGDWLARLRHAWVWIVLQFAGVALLIALGLLWTRIPDKHVWQVLLTLLMPLMLLAGFVWLQAGTFRGFLHPARSEGTPRIAIWWGAATLVIWIAIGWALWFLLDKFDDNTWNWAGYLNSKADPSGRTHWASFENLSRDLEWAAWVLRWVVVPGLLMPLACSAAWGFRRLPWRRVLRLLIEWRWWPAVLGCALAGEAWPQTWFKADPHGTVGEQVTRVVLKVAAAYLLAMVCWVKLIAWTAMLLDDPAPDGGGEAVAEPAIGLPPGQEGEVERLPLPDGGEGVSGNA
jgi:hypothetical protein